MKCPTCGREVKYLYSNWDNPINGGILNVCKYCAVEQGILKIKGLRELNKERKNKKLNK